MFCEKNLIDVLRETHATYGTLAPAVETDAFRGFLASDLLAGKIARFSDTTYDPAETAGLYEDNTVVFVLDHEGWSITLIRHDALSRMVYALPFPTLLGPIEGACALDLYDYPKHLDEDPGEAASARARRVGSIELDAGRFWASSFDAPAYRLSSQASRSLFLRVTGPQTAPYTHAFARDDLRYLHSGFATPEVTGMDIYSRLMRAAAEHGAFADMESDDADAVAMMLEGCVASARTAPPSAWNLVQALHAVDPVRSIAMVETLANRPGPLAHVARTTLEGMRA
jgi:hypothetical protein